MPTCSPSDCHGGAVPHSSELPHKRGTIVDSVCWFRPDSLLKTCDWCLFFDAEVGSAAICPRQSTPFHHWKCCIRHNTAEVCSCFTLPALLVCDVLWQLYFKGSGTRLVFESWLEVFLSGICTFSPVFSWCLVSQYEKMTLTLSRYFIFSIGVSMWAPVC